MCLYKTDNSNNNNYDISNHHMARCASAKLMAATKTTQLQKPPWASTKQLSKLSLLTSSILPTSDPKEFLELCLSDLKSLHRP